MTYLGLHGPGFEPLKLIVLFSKKSNPALGPTQSPIQLQRELFPGGKAAGA